MTTTHILLALARVFAIGIKTPTRPMRFDQLRSCCPESATVRTRTAARARLPRCGCGPPNVRKQVRTGLVSTAPVSTEVSVETKPEREIVEQAAATIVQIAE